MGSNPEFGPWRSLLSVVASLVAVAVSSVLLWRLSTHTLVAVLVIGSVLRIVEGVVTGHLFLTGIMARVLGYRAPPSPSFEELLASLQEQRDESPPN